MKPQNEGKKESEQTEDAQSGRSVGLRSDGSQLEKPMEDPETAIRNKQPQGRASSSTGAGPSSRLPNPTVGVTENRTKLLVDQVIPKVQEWMENNLTERVTELLEATAPAFLDSYWRDQDPERLPAFADLVANYIYNSFLNPVLPESPLPSLVKRLVKEVIEEGGNVPEVGTARPPLEQEMPHPPTIRNNTQVNPRADAPTGQADNDEFRIIYLPKPDSDDEEEKDDDCPRKHRRRDDRKTRDIKSKKKGKGQEDRSRRKRNKKNIRKKRRDDSSSSSSSNSDDSDTDPSSTDDSGNSTESDRTEKHRSSRRRRYKLEVIRPMHEIFKKAVDYRLYRLDKTDDRCGNIPISRLHKKISGQMKDQTFSGEDPIAILGFLARYKDACNHNEISEGDALWCMQYFLTGQAATLVQARLSGNTMAIDAKRNEMLTNYSELVNFLLHNYATDDAMAEALADVEGFKQTTALTERQYSDELWKRALRCGTVFSSNRMKGYFVEGVLPAIRSQLRNYATDHPRSSYEAVVRYAKGLGASYRSVRKVGTPTFKMERTGRTVHPRKAAAFTVEESDTEYTAEIGETDNAVLALGYHDAGPTMHSMSTGPPTPDYRTPPPENNVTERNGGNKNTQVTDKTRRCRICLSTEHTVCDLITDPIVRDYVMKVRDQNYRKIAATRAGGRREWNFTKEGTTPSARTPTILRRPPGRNNPGGTVNVVDEEFAIAEEMMPIPGRDADDKRRLSKKD